jgi:class 3 adenylate cyclase/tetratricopeptide (TPR) repeat protein
MQCGSCGTTNRPGRRFCSHCGAPLAVTCPACGAANEPEDRFCGDCGTPLAPPAAPAPVAAPAEAPEQGVAERRLVTVLFADLVGFTTLAERRDPEEVRDLLSRYFDRCRALIERYGGTVEKFIGDAVMAVWGTPVAREDDAERAVRAALVLTQAVSALGEEVGMPELRVRAGVLTGPAAVNVGVEGEGMVLGDTVNTASRLQSVAEPGSVLVDDVTRRASEAAIAYEEGGTHEVRGRDEPVHAWRALRVVAGVGGARRSAGLEAPFVGRDAELEAVIAASDASAAEGRARLVSVLGEAGIGKSRLLWEFYKHIDGISEEVRWHQGRCLSYGEGVGYWALAEMIRSRAGILEEESPESARAKLRASVEEFVSDERERRLVEPRLAHLLRLEERPDADRADLFSGWRLFFERMADESPVLLVFEDVQWADSGLLDFIDYLLEWSADHRIFVLTLGRPEVAAKRAGWGEDRPDRQALTLRALSPEAIETMLDGLAPGLPAELVARIRDRAEGVPLYAVEIVRMLLDRGLLVQEGQRYVVSGEVEDLDVPETLHALVASRLDGLSGVERALLQDAAVLGQSFTPVAVAALSGRPEREVTEHLDALVAKQVLARDDDARSPERGSYAFLQALLRTVAYGTLSRKSRKARHLAAARHLQASWPGEAADIAEVLASHYLEAVAAEPEAPDVPEIRASARETLARAGQAAISLALGPEARRYFQQAAELAEDDATRARLLEQAGRAAGLEADTAGAEVLLREALDLYERAGQRRAAAPASVILANVIFRERRVEEAIELLQRTHDDLGGERGDALEAEVAAWLARAQIVSGDREAAGPLLESALHVAENQQAWSILADALITRCVYLIYDGRREEGQAVLKHALELAREHGPSSAAVRAHFNLAAVHIEADRYAEALAEVERGLDFARERGDRGAERQLLSQKALPLARTGRWDESLAVAERLMADNPSDEDSMFVLPVVAGLLAARGDDAGVLRCGDTAAAVEGTGSEDTRACVALTRAIAAQVRGENAETVAAARAVLSQDALAMETIEDAYATCVAAALTLGDEALEEELIAHVDGLPPARATAFLRGQRHRLAARLAAARGRSEQADEEERAALALFREMETPFPLAQVLLDRAGRLPGEAAPLLAEARGIFERLGAAPWAERAAAGATAAAA